MSDKNDLAFKLKETACKVDSFIDKILEPRKPEILYNAARHLIYAGGKRLRPYLTVKSCELVGGDPDVAVPFASALEMLHNFTLIHDDIMDNDAKRRGAPTVHQQWGEPMAILSGDFLFAKVYQAMILPALEGKVAPDRVISCIDKITEATVVLCEGQALDISFPNVLDVSEEDYIFMVGGKTASLFNACAEIGAIVGGGDENEVKNLGIFAWNAGIAFQIIDDVLGLTSEENVLGKPIGNDLREGKKTLIVIHAYKNASEDEREILEKVLGINDAEASDIKAAISILSKNGSIDYAKEKAEAYVEKALKSLDGFPESETKTELVELVEYFKRRVY